MTPTTPVTDDSDGDGIPNVIEGTTDIDHDGLPNYLDKDADGDGIPDAMEGAADTDGDGKANLLDLDSDNDGIPDNVEAQTTQGFVTPVGKDSNHDGVDDAYQPGLTPVDTDGDGTPDTLDTDSDNDAVLDKFEARRGTITATDTDGDGIDDGFDHINGPSIADGIVNPALDLSDTDKDATLAGNVDYRDADDDGDGVLTAYENPDPRSQWRSC